jgi:hypothetical protein
MAAISRLKDFAELVPLELKRKEHLKMQSSNLYKVARLIGNV